MSINITLYDYNHCPYCVRIHMMLKRKNIKAKIITLTYDDAETPTKIYGKKVLPFIIKPDNSILGESLDIISYLDNIDSSPILSDKNLPEEVNQAMRELRPYASKLYKPRIVKTNIIDFSTQGAIEYAENKFAKKNGESFAQWLEQSNDFLPHAQENLNKIGELLNNTTNFYDEIFSMADIHLFPTLRNLTVVKDLVFPDNLKQYLQYQAEQADLKLFFDEAN